MGAAYKNALAIAEKSGDTEYQLRALVGLYYFHAAQQSNSVLRCHLRKGSMI